MRAVRDHNVVPSRAVLPTASVDALNRKLAQLQNVRFAQVSNLVDVHEMGDQVNLIYGVLVLDLCLRTRAAQKRRVSHSCRLAFWLRVYSSNRIRTRNVAVLKLGLAIRPADPLLARWLLRKRALRLQSLRFRDELLV